VKKGKEVQAGGERQKSQSTEKRGRPIILLFNGRSIVKRDHYDQMVLGESRKKKKRRQGYSKSEAAPRRIGPARKGSNADGLNCQEKQRKMKLGKFRHRQRTQRLDFVKHAKPGI